MPHVCVTKLRSVSPYSQSRKHGDAKIDKESADGYEKRTWRSKMHVEDGKLFIPPMAFKFCIAAAAQFLGIKIPGRGKKTWKDNFLAGILVLDGLKLPDDPEKIPSWTGPCHANGDRK